MIIDFRHNSVPPNPFVIKNCTVERVDSYKYLGVHIDNELKWNVHIDNLIKKVNVRMYCMRKLHTFSVNPTVLAMFYNSVICSVWRYCLLGWGGNSSKSNKDKINNQVRRAGRTVGIDLMEVDCMYHDLLDTKLDSVLNDSNHPLHNNIKNCLIPRSGRLRMPTFGTRTRHPLSFIPRAMRLYNCKVKR